MENVFINSVSSLIEIIAPIQEIKKILPVKLRKACSNHADDLYSHNNDRKDENCFFQNETIELQHKFYPGLMYYEARFKKLK